MKRVERLVSAAAEASHGVLHVSVLAAHGLHESARRRLVADGLLRRKSVGVYSIADDLNTRGSYEHRCAAALTTAGPDSMLAREAAARWHELDGFAPRRRTSTSAPIAEQPSVAGREPSVNVPRSSGRRGSNLHRVDSTAHPSTFGGLRVTGIGQTLCELGSGLAAVESPGKHRLLPIDQVELALECALHRKLITLDHLGLAFDACGGTHRGAAVLRAALARRPPDTLPTESWLETRTVKVLRSDGIIDVERQVTIFDRRGRRIGRVDLRIGGLLIECDSQEFHPEFDKDRARWAKLQAAGYLTLPVTFRQVEFETPDFLRSVRDLLALDRSRAVG